MATIFNEQCVLGVRLVADGTLMHNGIPVIGISAAADGLLFSSNLRTLGVAVLDADAAIYNDQPVLGAVLISDSRSIYNGRLVVPAHAVSGVLSYDPSAALGADLLGYWDAERADLMTVAGGTVSSWRDVKAAYNLVQATGAAQPAYSATSFNGHPGITFDGTDDFLSLTTHPFPINADPSEIWAVVSQAALVADATARYAVAMGGGTPTSRAVARQVSGGANQARGIVGNGTTTASSAASAAFSTRHLVRVQTSATDVTVSLDGVAATSAAIVPATANTRIRFGAFAATSAAGFWNGQIAAVLVTAPLSAPKAAALQTWLLSRRRL